MLGGEAGKPPFHILGGWETAFPYYLLVGAEGEGLGREGVGFDCEADGACVSGASEDNGGCAIVEASCVAGHEFVAT